MPRILFRLLISLSAAAAFSGLAFAGTKFQVVYNFVGGNNALGPTPALTIDGAGRLYGASYGGGSTTACDGNGCGTVFQLVPKNGHWGERVLTNFPNATEPPYASSPVVLDSAGNIYGVGTNSYTSDGQFVAGELFQLTNNKGPYTESAIYYFSGGDGDANGINQGLVRDAKGNLYGSSAAGGSSNQGTVFEFSPNGDGTWTETLIFEFGSEKSSGPNGNLMIDKAGNLYGTTQSGGDYGWGGVYRLSNGNGTWKFQELYDFPPFDPAGPGGLVIDGAGHLYGNTQNDGFGVGSLYKLTPNKGYWTYSLIHSFTGSIDGGYASGGLALDATGNIYGTTLAGGLYGNGTVFEFSPGADGKWSETVLYNFMGTADGYAPYGVIRDSKGNLYGIAVAGGIDLNGLVFEITP